MRKVVLTIAACLVATGAFAFPATGDRNVYVGTYTGAEGGELPFTQILELGSYSPKSRQFKMTNTFLIGENDKQQKQEQAVDVAIDTLQDEARTRAILENCDAAGGEAVKITVPAGTYDSCKVPTDKGEGAAVWVAPVPFGFVKEIYFEDDGSRIDVELQTSVSGG